MFDEFNWVKAFLLQIHPMELQYGHLTGRRIELTPSVSTALFQIQGASNDSADLENDVDTSLKEKSWSFCLLAPNNPRTFSTMVL